MSSATSCWTSVRFSSPLSLRQRLTKAAVISCYAATNYASELKQLMACKYMHGLNQVTQEFSNKGG